MPLAEACLEHVLGADTQRRKREEAIKRLFCPLLEKFHTSVLRGLRNICEAP